MLDSRTAVVEGHGTAFDSAGGVLQQTLQEAARQTLAAGYQYFGLMSASDASQAGTMVSGGNSFTSGAVYGSATAYGNRGTYSGQYVGNTITTPVVAHTIVRPGVNMLVRMFHEGEVEPAQAGIYSATEVLSLAPGAN